MLQRIYNFKEKWKASGGGQGSNGLTYYRRSPATALAITLIALIIILTAPPLLAAPSAQEPAGQQNLIDKAQRQGRVRVIVSLDVAFQPEDRLASPQDVQNQRQRIQRAQGSVLQKMAGTNLTVVARFKYIPAMTVDLDAAALANLATLPEVATLTEDRPVPLALDSSIPIIGADQAWAAGFTGQGQTVAILDTGVDKTHPFFSANGNKVVSEACYSSNNPAEGASSVCPGGATESILPGSGLNCTFAISSCRHGTHVAGIAAGNDGLHAGVAKEANLIAIQVFSRLDDGLTPGAPTPCADAGTSSPCALSFITDQIKALERVFELRNDFNIAAVNMSLGGGQHFTPCDNEPIKAAIDHLRAAGIATVIASGNSGYLTSISSPACVSSAISVGATDDFDNIAPFSNIASFLSLLAPGVDIYSAIPGGGLDTLDGTSMATPHVTGAWAVLKQQRPGASVGEILSLLRQTGVSVDDHRPLGEIIDLRRINLEQAIAAPPPQTRIYLPIIFGGAGIDLVVDCICGAGFNRPIVRNENVPCPPHTSLIEVTIRNQGARPVTETFWVDLYFNPDPPPTGVNQIWDDGRASYGLAWGVTEAALPLGPGETLTLTTDLDDPYLMRAHSKLPPGPLTNAAIYAQVDSINLNTNYGGVLENHEVNGGAYNNIIGGRRDFDFISLGGLQDDDLGQPTGIDHLPARP